MILPIVSPMRQGFDAPGSLAGTVQCEPFEIYKRFSMAVFAK
ncbi:hypothetical protein Y88_2439 [Novosphingobium nitrogenifigens DSM 19370]|uniref:Uncharacterized protein n=1 Tax=Novosphingobium nitrogenifigens DSM 19370 TaxID=983920 RepID=F1Z6J5_9SPHN|nr:hypothetical protein [Novosphingobium nitrogenifigens]EGD59655.1 hypothetical protein Y88_2439 [Novosphingobium nitrogenifigens DSM 19370]